MKMLKDHYEVLSKAVTAVLSSHGGPSVVWKHYQDRGLSARRCRWDTYWAARNTSAELRAIDFGYLFNDHIDTALKRATNIK